MGFTVMCMPNNGQVVEYDKNKKERWKITGLNNPWDAQVIGNAVRVAVMTLRRKLGDPPVIATLPGAGYQLQ